MSEIILAKDPFEGLEGGVMANTMTGTKHMKIAIVGKPKIGKSWLAASLPGTTQVYDFDNRAASLAGKPGVRVTTLHDRNQTNPMAIKSLESELSTWQYKATQGIPNPDNIVLDSGTYMRRFMAWHLMKLDPGLGRAVSIDKGKSFMIESNYDVHTACRGYMEKFFAEFAELANLVVVFHERPQKDEVATSKTKDAKGNPIQQYTGGLVIEPPSMFLSLSTFNECFRVFLDGSGDRKVSTVITKEFNSATTFKGVKSQEEPDLALMLQKNEAERKRLGLWPKDK